MARYSYEVLSKELDYKEPILRICCLEDGLTEVVSILVYHKFAKVVLDSLDHFVD
jgi:hypothetical protein